MLNALYYGLKICFWLFNQGYTQNISEKASFDSKRWNSCHIFCNATKCIPKNLRKFNFYLQLSLLVNNNIHQNSNNLQ